MIILDSSFLIAFFHEKDSLHDKAITQMKEYEEKKEEFIITEHVLGETATVLLYYSGLNAASTFLDYAKQNYSIQGWDKDDFEATLSVFKGQKNQLSYIDASIVYLSVFLQTPVATYDLNILKEIQNKSKKR